MERRLAIASNRDGRSTVLRNIEMPRTAFISTRGFEADLLWQTDAAPVLDIADPMSPTEGQSVLPNAGGTSLFVVTFPPDSVMAEPDFDPAAAGHEYAVRLPGLAELFERDNPGMHQSDTIDYDIVLDGRITVEFDDQQSLDLKRGDILIQHGTRHAWRNNGTGAATMIFVLIGATRGPHDFSLVAPGRA